MNETTMYALKPIITRSGESRRDSCMYEMKNIHSERVEHACQENGIVADIAMKDPSEVTELEARQAKILAQLADFQEQVLKLFVVLKGKGAENEACVTTNDESSGRKREAVVADIVVKTDPSMPCYAVQALAKIWKDVDFDVNCYTHSSVLGETPAFRIERRKAFIDCVKLSLIWKKVEDLEVVISGVHAYPIVGETNLLRYLLRQFPANLEAKFSTPEALTSLDSILDLSHRLTYEESPKEVQSTLSQLGDKLGKNNWLTKDSNPGIADAAAWAAIKRISLAKLPANLSAWFDRCEKSFR